VLLNKIFATKEEDRYYFLYNYFCRSWILLQSLIFGVFFIAIVFEVIINIKQLFFLCGIFILFIGLDGLRVYVKWWKMNKELTEEELSIFGHKKYH
jgi:hypothetical protein